MADVLLVISIRQENYRLLLQNSDQLKGFEGTPCRQTYRYMDDALFPFGFGLSYTTFEIGKATADKTQN